ncbi:MAG: hypothetical protein AB7O90_15950 [Hyphomicrobium sp.]
MAFRIAGGLLMAIALAFATALIFDVIRQAYGARTALSVLGIFFAVSSVLTYAVADHLATQRAHADVEPPPNENIEGKETAKTENSDAGSDPLSELVELLGTAGLRKEALGVLAAKGVLGDVKPIQLVLLALVAGFIAGRGR